MALLPDPSTEAAGGITVASKGTAGMPNKTYRMRIEEERVMGTVTDSIAAVRQAAYKILNTERYKHIIYSWNYGVELQDLFGKPIPYVLPEIPRRIREALIQDDRITDVTDFDLSYTKTGDVLAKFTIHTIYGTMEGSREVKV